MVCIDKGVLFPQFRIALFRWFSKLPVIRREVTNMMMTEFCNDLSRELAGWKGRLHDIISHVETLPALDRQYFAPDVNALRALISELDDRARKLKVECPVDFGTAAKAA
jgi:hypothetical protein